MGSPLPWLRAGNGWRSVPAWLHHELLVRNVRPDTWVVRGLAWVVCGPPPQPLDATQRDALRRLVAERRSAAVLAAAERWERAWAAWDSDLSTPSTALAAEVRSAHAALLTAVRARRAAG